jgi:type I restriction enzyme S subunit
VTIDRERVGDVLRLERRAVDVEPDRMYAEIGVRSFGRGIFDKNPVSGTDLGNKRVFRVEPQDLVISNVFAWEGAIAVASEADAGKIGSHRFMTFVPKDGRIDSSWAAYFFRSQPGLELIRQASPGSAGRNRTLAIDRFGALEIPLPPVDEQRRVARGLDRVASGSGALRKGRARSSEITSALPIAVRVQAEREVPLGPARLGDVLELVRDPVKIDPIAPYVSIGIRSFGRGVFHYPARPGAQIGKLRFQAVPPRLLAISNIKGWEGAVATTEAADSSTVASNRFLFFRPLAGDDATDYFWGLLLGTEGLAALGHASPGSADRNRTLAVDRFNTITLDMPELDQQAEIGRRVSAARQAVTALEARADASARRIEALLPAALHQAFAWLT